MASIVVFTLQPFALASLVYCTAIVPIFCKTKMDKYQKRILFLLVWITLELALSMHG